MDVLDINELESLTAGTMDETGDVFHYKGQILRGIRAESEKWCRELFDSGLIHRLIGEGMIPETKILDIQIPGYSMVLEHALVYPITYVYEWSFSMNKDAALMILELNKIAREYGYETKDCHQYNVLFQHNKPIFIDIGSFQKLRPGAKNWVALEEFVRAYYYPLKLWQDGEQFLVQTLQNNQPRGRMPHSSYYYYKRSLARLFSRNFLDKFYGNFYKLKNIDTYSDEELRWRTPNNRGDLIIKLRNLNLLPFQTVQFNKWIRKLKRIKLKKRYTMWADYHTEFKQDGQLVLSDRFERIIEKISELDIKTLTEFAGNQGVVSEAILAKTEVEQVICTDYDTQAIDVLYNRLKESDLHIVPMVVDVLFPVEVRGYPNLEERLEKADCVLALALTHHLLITQGMQIEQIFTYFKLFTKKYILIEFMPKGLWFAGAKKENIHPEWYHFDWFKEEFDKHFEIIEIEQLEQNRILFVGKVLS